MPKNQNQADEELCEAIRQSEMLEISFPEIDGLLEHAFELEMLEIEFDFEIGQSLSEN